MLSSPFRNNYICNVYHLCKCLKHLEKTMILIANVPQWGKIYGRDKPRFKGKGKIALNQDSYYWFEVIVLFMSI